MSPARPPDDFTPPGDFTPSRPTESGWLGGSALPPPYGVERVRLPERRQPPEFLRCAVFFDVAVQPRFLTSSYTMRRRWLIEDRRFKTTFLSTPPNKREFYLLSVVQAETTQAAPVNLTYSRCFR